MKSLLKNVTRILHGLVQAITRNLVQKKITNEFWSSKKIFFFGQRCTFILRYIPSNMFISSAYMLGDTCHQEGGGKETEYHLSGDYSVKERTGVLAALMLINYKVQTR